MVGVGTIARIRFEHYQNGKGIKRIACELGIARDTVRKVLCSNVTAFAYERGSAPAQARRLRAGPDWIEAGDHAGCGV